MKRILLSLLLILVLALSACSLTGFTPWQSQDLNGTVLDLNDTFEFVNIPVDGDNSSVDILVEVEVEDSTADSLILTTVEATEGDLISLADILAEDPDGDSVDYAYSEPFNSRGLWQTNDGDEGKYLVDVTASDGVLSTTEQVKIVVLASNKAPVVDCPSNFVVSEGDLIDLPCTIYDLEGDRVSYAVTGFMSDLTYQTTYDDAGEYVVVVTANDGSKTTAKEISLVIENTNRKPVVENVAPLSLFEGDTVVIVLNATDADGDDLTVEYPSQFNANGVWSTSRGDAGTYEFEVTVSDGLSSVIVPVEVFVGKINVAPVIAPIDTIVVNEGDLIELPINITDEDGDAVIMVISGFMTSDTYQTTYDDAGEYTVTIKIRDGSHAVSMDVDIIINDVNRPPVFIAK